MEIDEIMTELRQFIRQQYKVPDDDSEFTDDVHLFDYGYIDSFGAVDLNSFVKTKLGVEVTATDLVAYPLNTIREIATFVAKRKKGEL